MSARIRVLVVDDSALMRKLIPQALVHDPSIEVVGTAMDGELGLKKITELRPNVVTLDLDMPRMDGIELITLLKKDAKLKSMPIVILSYKDREEDRRRGLDAGADHYLTKASFHDNTLVQMVVDLIGESNV
jgi:two-component system sensor histidine kinase and response regulator WspE